MAVLTSPRILKHGLTLFAAVSAVGVVLLLVVTGAWETTLHVFAQVHPGWLAAALGLAALDWLGGGLRIWLLARHVHRPTPFWGMVVAGGLNNWGSHLTPSQAGGGPLMIYAMKRFGVPIPEAMTSTLVSFMATVVFLAVAGPVAVVLGAGRSLDQHGVPLVNLSLYDVFRMTAGVFALVGGLALAPFLFPGSVRRLFHGAIGWLERHRGGAMARRVETWRAGVDRMHDCLVAYARGRGWLAMLGGVLSTALALANRLVAGFVVLRALGIHASFVDVLILQTTISFLLYFAPTPGGSGAAEALSAALMSVYVPRAALPAYTILWRFTVSYATVIFGSFVFYRLLRGRLEEAEGAAVT